MQKTKAKALINQKKMKQNESYLGLDVLRQLKKNLNYTKCDSQCEIIILSSVVSIHLFINFFYLYFNVLYQRPIYLFLAYCKRV